MEDDGKTGNGPDQVKKEKDAPERVLYNVTANGFTVTSDAFAALPPAPGGRHRRLWFISLLGPVASVRAVAACITKQKTEAVSITPQNGPDQWRTLTYEKDPESGAWTSPMMRLPLSRAAHCFCYSTMAHFDLDEPKFLLIGEPGRKDENSDARMHLQFMKRRSFTPLHPMWDRWLWERGEGAGEIVRMESAGIPAWFCSPNEERLRADISAEIASHNPELPTIDITE